MYKGTRVGARPERVGRRYYKEKMFDAVVEKIRNDK